MTREIQSLDRNRTELRPIDWRFVPPVQGIDLEQSMNYLDLQSAGEEFIYDHYTSRMLFYKQGSRPVLEHAVREALDRAITPISKVMAIAHWVASHVKWAGYHKLEHGVRLPDNTAPTEESLIEKGYGCCNEQSRLFCLMTQIAGIPSRIVFASNPATHYGHCVAEVLLDNDWMMVDQSLGYCFVLDGRAIRASRVYHDPESRAYFSPIYKKMCMELQARFGDDLTNEFTMATAADPLDGFISLGFMNYFAH